MPNWTRLSALATALVFGASAILAQSRASESGRGGVDGDIAGALRLLPPQAVAGVVINNPDQLVKRLHAWVEDEASGAAGLLERITNNPQFAQGQVFYMVLAATVGQTGWGLPESLLGGQIAAALVPRGNAQGPGVVLIAGTSNAELLDHVLNRVYQLAGLVRNGEPDPARTHDVDGIRVFAFGEREKNYQCRVGQWTVFANDGELIAGVIRRGKRKSGPEEGASVWAAAHGDVPKNAAAWTFVDLAAVRNLPKAEFPEKLREAAPAYFFGQWYHAIRTGKRVVGWFELDRDAWRMTLKIDGADKLPPTHRGFAAAPTTQVVWQARTLPRYLAETTLNVGWADLFAEREALLTTQGASDVNNFSTTLSNIFGGVDFLHEILPAIGGPTRLILARQEFDASKTVPSPKLPAFALVAPLREESVQRMTQRLFSASQSAISILNLDMAQKGQPTYLLDVDRHNGYKFLFTEFGEPDAMSGMQMSPAGAAPTAASEPSKKPSTNSDAPAMAKDADHTAGVRYNFLPAAAVVEGQYVLATSKDLLTDIVDSIARAKKAGGPRLPEAAAATLDIDGPSVAAILKDNFRELVINQMLEKSSPKAEAERNIQLFLDLLSLARGLHVNSTNVDGKYEARIELGWKTAAK